MRLIVLFQFSVDFQTRKWDSIYTLVTFFPFPQNNQTGVTGPRNFEYPTIKPRGPKQMQFL